MPPIKFRIKLNRPGNTILVSKFHHALGNFTEYLKSLGADLGIGASENWLMSDATQQNQNDAISFNILSRLDYNQHDIDTFSTALSWPKQSDSDSHFIPISYRTKELFVKITNNFEHNDKFIIGTFSNKSQRPSNWTVINKEIAEKIESDISSMIEFYGDIQGIIKSIVKEKKRNKCKITELIFDSVIDCEFENNIYHDVITLLKERDTIVHAYGPCFANPRTKRIIKMKIEKIVESPSFAPEDIDRFRGCFPTLISDYSTDNLPEWLTND